MPITRTSERPTIVAAGDEKDFDSYVKFVRNRELILRKGFGFASTDYARLLKRGFPRTMGGEVILFFYFPFSWWDRHIEYEGYRGVYGNRFFCSRFLRFWTRIRGIIRKELPDTRIFIVNHPLLCALCRDKVELAKRLSRAGIPQPRHYRTADVGRVLGVVRRGRELYIKPRCGSMGKGITFLRKGAWKTNFILDGAKIVSPATDYGWRFRDVTGNYTFLERLLKKDVIIQEAVDELLLKGMKIDLRVYTFLGKVLYIYPRTNRPERITTNISQGGRGAPRAVALLPKRQVSRARRVAARVAETLGAGLLGIDIALDRNKKDVCVLDINAFPGFPRKKTYNLTKRMIELLAEKRKRGRLPFVEGRDV